MKIRDLSLNIFATLKFSQEINGWKARSGGTHFVRLAFIFIIKDKVM